MPELPSTDELIANLMGAMNERATSSKGYMQGDLAEHTWGIPIPTLALQYGIGGSSVLPLQRYLGISGKRKSYKSTLEIEIGNWFMENNGYHSYLDTEHKTSPTMLDAMSWWREADCTRRIYKTCSDITEWQDMVTTAVTQVRAIGKRPPGERVPVFVSIDSLLGRSTAEAVETLEKEGHAASRGYPIGNLQITNYLETLSLLGTTVGVSWVQHMKESMEQGSWGKTYKEKGPQASQFSTSIHLRLSKSDKAIHYENYPTAPFPDLPVEGHLLYIKTQLSCVGPDQRTIEVPLLWQYVPQDDGTRRQAMFYDWNYAIGSLLHNMKYNADFKPKQYKSDKALLDDALHFTCEGKNINCASLGLEKASLSEFGHAVESDPDVRTSISKFLNITQYNGVQEADIDFNAQPTKKKGKKK